MGLFAREKQTVQYPFACDAKDIVVSTTHHFEGFQIELYIGVVSGDVVFDPTFTRREENCVRDRVVAVHHMVRKAHDIGANAVVGMSFNCGSFQRQGTKKAVCSISAYGTAVRIKARDEG